MRTGGHAGAATTPNETTFSDQTSEKRTRKKVRWHHRPWVRHVLAWLIANYIRLVDRSGRWEMIVPPSTAELVREGRPFIGAFWHGRLLMIYPAWRRLLAEIGEGEQLQSYVISSAHGDGQLIQLATKRFGPKTLWGSSRRGGLKVLLEARRVLNEGHIVVMTPDGPRGPRMRAHAGVAYLAGKSDVPVVPITFAAKRQRTLGSWDRFMLVWPFSSGVVAFGEPILPTVAKDTESRRRHIEDRMIAFASAVDRSQGLEPIEPADAGQPNGPRGSDGPGRPNERVAPVQPAA